MASMDGFGSLRVILVSLSSTWEEKWILPNSNKTYTDYLTQTVGKKEKKEMEVMHSG